MLSEIVYSKKGGSEAFRLLSEVEQHQKGDTSKALRLLSGVEQHQKGARWTERGIGGLSIISVPRPDTQRLLNGRESFEYEMKRSCDCCGSRTSDLEMLVLGYATGLCLDCEYYMNERMPK